MNKELLNELIEETQMTDISEKYLDIVEIIGIRKFVELSNYARGDEIYFPKMENVIAPARNRRIKKEFNGSNEKELAEKYNITIKQVWNILKDSPPVGQMSLEEWMKNFEVTDKENPT
ncbi:MAG: Mor transcription activator family protein [Lachnospiraceae bacterium]